jgi:hypothetical protein
MFCLYVIIMVAYFMFLICNCNFNYTPLVVFLSKSKQHTTILEKPAAIHKRSISWKYRLLHL